MGMFSKKPDKTTQIYNNLYILVFIVMSPVVDLSSLCAFCFLLFIYQLHSMLLILFSIVTAFRSSQNFPIPSIPSTLSQLVPTLKYGTNH